MSGALSGPRCDEEWVPGVSLPIWLQGGENWSCRGSFRWRSALEKERQRGDEKTEKWSKKVTLTIHAPKTTNTHVNHVGGEPTGDVVRKESTRLRRKAGRTVWRRGDTTGARDAKRKDFPGVRVLKVVVRSDPVSRD